MGAGLILVDLRLHCPSSAPTMGLFRSRRGKMIPEELEKEIQKAKAEVKEWRPGVFPCSIPTSPVPS